MIFEPGNWYRHSTGRCLFIHKSIDTIYHGQCLLGEDSEGTLLPIGMNAENAMYYSKLDRLAALTLLGHAAVEAERIYKLRNKV